MFITWSGLGRKSSLTRYGESRATEWVGGLTKFHVATNECVLLEYTFSNHLRVEVWQVGHVLDGLLKVYEISGHHVQKYCSKNIIFFNFTHCSDLFVEGMSAGEGISERSIISKMEFESFDQQADLGVSTLVVTVRSQCH